MSGMKRGKKGAKKFEFRKNNIFQRPTSNWIPGTTIIFSSRYNLISQGGRACKSPPPHGTELPVAPPELCKFCTLLPFFGLCLFCWTGKLGREGSLPPFFGRTNCVHPSVPDESERYRNAPSVTTKEGGDGGKVWDSTIKRFFYHSRKSNAYVNVATGSCTLNQAYFHGKLLDLLPPLKGSTAHRRAWKETLVGTMGGGRQRWMQRSFSSMWKTEFFCRPSNSRAEK